LVVAAINEWMKVSEPREFWPRLVVKPSQGPNLISLAVEYQHIPAGGPAGPEGG
jgi:hypothetical protein